MGADAGGEHECCRAYSEVCALRNHIMWWNVLILPLNTVLILPLNTGSQTRTKCLRSPRARPVSLVADLLIDLSPILYIYMPAIDRSLPDCRCAADWLAAPGQDRTAGKSYSWSINRWHVLLNPLAILSRVFHATMATRRSSCSKALRYTVLHSIDELCSKEWWNLYNNNDGFSIKIDDFRGLPGRFLHSNDDSPIQNDDLCWQNDDLIMKRPPLALARRSVSLILHSHISYIHAGAW